MSPDDTLPDVTDPAVPRQHGPGPQLLAGHVSPRVEDLVREEPAEPCHEPGALLLQRQPRVSEGLPA